MDLDDMAPIWRIDSSLQDNTHAHLDGLEDFGLDPSFLAHCRLLGFVNVVVPLLAKLFPEINKIGGGLDGLEFSLGDDVHATVVDGIFGRGVRAVE